MFQIVLLGWGMLQSLLFTSPFWYSPNQLAQLASSFFLLHNFTPFLFMVHQIQGNAKTLLLLHFFLVVASG
jgi:hypothetical protein